MAKIGFQIYALGCKVNQYDAAVLRRSLEARGFSISRRPELVIINTCSVTKSAIQKDRQLAARLRRTFPNARLVIMGCWPQTDEGIKKSMDDKKIIFWGVGKTAALVVRLSRLYPEAKPRSDMKVLESGLIASSERSRYFIKVGDGCNQFCSYCLIPFARGRLTSRPSGELLEEIKAATKAGYREIILSGIHLGRYGEDDKKEIDLVGLLKKILSIKDLGRVRLSSIEINEVTPALIKFMSAEPRICRHLHISLQSGSDKILKAMRRPYDTPYFSRRVVALRRALPEIAISTDIIAGFPGESELDFQDTMMFARRMKFSKIHAFSFSAHEKTLAYSLPDKVSPSEIKSRSAALRKLSDELEQDYREQILKSYRKKPLSLVAEKGGGAKVRVKTEFGFDLYLNQQELAKNRLV